MSSRLLLGALLTLALIASAGNCDRHLSDVVPFSRDLFAQERGSTDVYIAALIPSNSDGSLLAFELALARVRRLSERVRLRLVYITTWCRPAKATKDLFDLLHYLPSAFVVFGSGCPGLTGAISQISYFFNISLVSYADTSPELEDETRYRNLVRIAPSDADFNYPRIRLLQMYNWTKSCSLYQDSSSVSTGDSSHQAAAKAKLDDMLEAAGFNMSFISSSRFMSFESAVKALQLFKQKEYRVISALTNQSLLAPLFCAAYNTGMHGARHVWILSGFRLSEKIWRPDSFNCAFGRCNCSRQQLLTAANNSLYIDFITYSTDTAQANYAQELEQLSRLATPEGGAFRSYAFDSVLAAAAAARKLLQALALVNTPLKYPALTPAELLKGEALKTSLLSSNFTGLTGTVQFSKKSRLGLLVLQQLAVSKDGETVNLTFLSEFDCSRMAFLSGDAALQISIVWPGGSPPRDRTEIESRLLTLQMWLFALFASLSGLGVVLSLALMVVNIKYRNHRYIKMSSPQMNNLIVAGCVLCYLSVVFLGTDAGLMRGDSGALTFICSTRAWILSVGFTLSFGAMFSKTWRVHCIFTNISMSKKIIKDYQLMLIVVFLLLVDVGILTAWMISDPMWREERLVSIEKLSNDREVHFYNEICSSKKLPLWIGLLFAYKGLLLIIGCFFAWETRNVSIPALNDSKYIGMSVYNVLVMCLAGAAVSFALKDNQSASFIITSSLIFFCTTITLALVFFPKLIELRRDPRGEEKRVRATLRKMSKRPVDEIEQERCSAVRLAKATEEKEQLERKLESKKAELQRLEDELRQRANRKSGSDSGMTTSVGKFNNTDGQETAGTAEVFLHNKADGHPTPAELEVWIRQHKAGGGSAKPRRCNFSDEELFNQEIADVQDRLLADSPRPPSQSLLPPARTPSYPGLARLPAVHASLRETDIISDGEDEVGVGGSGAGLPARFSSSTSDDDEDNDDDEDDEESAASRSWLQSSALLLTR